MEVALTRCTVAEEHNDALPLAIQLALVRRARRLRYLGGQWRRDGLKVEGLVCVCVCVCVCGARFGWRE